MEEKQETEKKQHNPTGMDLFLLFIILALTILLIYTLWESKEHEKDLWQYYNRELARQGCIEPFIPEWMTSGMALNNSWDYYGGKINASGIQSQNS